MLMEMVEERREGEVVEPEVHLSQPVFSTRDPGLANLVEDAAIVRIKSSLIEEQAFLYYVALAQFDGSKLFLNTHRHCFHIRLLKLLTGVEISTLPVSKCGSAGNATASSTRSAAAEPKSSVLSWPLLTFVVAAIVPLSLYAHPVAMFLPGCRDVSLTSRCKSSHLRSISASEISDLAISAVHEILAVGGLKIETFATRRRAPAVQIRHTAYDCKHASH